MSTMPRGPSARAGSPTSAGGVDGPTDGDRRRLRNARRQARARLAEIEAERKAAVAAVFRDGVRQAVRSASPLLVSLLAKHGLTLDDVVGLLEPSELWLTRVGARGGTRKDSVTGHLFRYYMAGAGSALAPAVSRHTFHRLDEDYLAIRVVGHSLELDARIGRVRLETRFGELRIELMDQLPEAVFTGCIGAMVDQVVDHRCWRGKGWRIVGIEEAMTPYHGQVLVVAAGSVPYRLPGAPPLRVRGAGGR